MKKTLLLFAVCLFLTISWFEKPLIMGSGESGLPFAYPKRAYELNATTWGDAVLGHFTQTTIPTYPYYFLLFKLDQVGVPMYLVQASTFFLLLLTGAFGMYYLMRASLKRNEQFIPVVSALFYILNPISMNLVWNRFQYNFMFFYALLPLALLLFSKGLKEKNFIYPIILGVLSLLFVYAFSGVFFIVLLFGLLFSFSLFHAFYNIRKIKEIIFAFFYFIFTLFNFVLLHCFWLLQFIYIFKTPQFAQITESRGTENLATLLSLSSKFELIIDVLTLHRISFYDALAEVWGGFYTSTFLIIIKFFIPLLLILSFILFFKKESRLRKLVNFQFFLFISLFFFGVAFFAKGVAQPLGGIFLFLFKRFSVFRIFRNPYEKIGILLPLVYAPLISLGIYLISKKLGEKRPFVSRLFVILTLLILFGILSYPMWTGKVFMSGIKPQSYSEQRYFVKVPDYYREINYYLEDKEGIFRVIAAPIAGGGITHNWEYGYSGVDVSNEFFDKAVLSSPPYVPHHDAIINRIEKVLYGSSDLYKIFTLVNAKYLLIRDDVDYEERGIHSPVEIKEFLNNPKRASVENGLVNIEAFEVKALIRKNYDENMWYLVEPKDKKERVDYSFKVNLKDFKQAKYSMELFGNVTEKRRGFVPQVAYKIPTEFNDWTNYMYFLLWVKSTNPGAVTVFIKDSDNYTNTWDGRSEEIYSVKEEELNEWKLLIFPLKFFTNKVSKFDINNVSKISFGFSAETEDEEIPVRVNISGGFLDKGQILNGKNIIFDKKFDKLEFYKLTDDFYQDRLFTTTQKATVGDLDALFFTDLGNLQTKGTAIYVKDQLNEEEKEKIVSYTLGETPPKLQFERVNPAIYQVSLKEAKNPFILVLLEGFNTQWKIYPGEIDWKYPLKNKALFERDHFMVNGFANSWFIDPGKLKGGEEKILTLYFFPQSFFELGKRITQGSLAISVFLIVLYSLRRIYVKQNFKNI